MSEVEVMLGILTITAGLATTLAWVVKKVFDFSERHAQVVENNTKSNDAVSSTLKQLTNDLQVHNEAALPAIEGGKMVGEVIKLMQGIANSQQATSQSLEIVTKSQQEMLEMIKEIHRSKK